MKEPEEKATPGSTLLNDEQRAWYREKFGVTYIRVPTTPPQFMNRRERRANGYRGPL